MEALRLAASTNCSNEITLNSLYFLEIASYLSTEDSGNPS